MINPSPRNPVRLKPESGLAYLRSELECLQKALSQWEERLDKLIHDLPAAAIPVSSWPLVDKHGGKFYYLNERLSRDEFSAAILEEYYGKWCYYGIYDVTIRSAGSDVNPRLVNRAADFFLSVARLMPNAKPESEEREIYSQIENRKLVTSHLHRERSRYLAGERKRHDDYKCQVCGLRFENLYGNIGQGFAEAHHRVPLNQLTGKVKTRLGDLATVCANCHRMLHRMEGKRSDVEKLRAIVRQHSRKKIW